MNRRLEDRIRLLCDEAIACHDTDNLYSTIEELRIALREHTRRLRVLAEARLVEGLPLQERRGATHRTLEEWGLEAA